MIILSIVGIKDKTIEMTDVVNIANGADLRDPDVIKELLCSFYGTKKEALSGNYSGSRSGICCKWSYMISNNTSIGYDIVSMFSPTWEHYSGEPHLPIVGEYPHDNLWEGEQLELRLSLIDHILKCLEEVDQEWLDKLYEDDYSE